jgi:cytochrome c2
LALALVVLLSACGGREQAAPQTVTTPAGDPARGRTLIAQYGCLTCHIVPGVEGPRGRLGPSLADIAKRPINGRLANTPETMAQWILSPRSLDPTATMPNTRATPEEARDMAAFLLTLR